MPASKLGRPCILIVEDYEDNRTMLELQLRMAGYEVVTASSCSQTLGYAQKTRFDLCLLDHYLADGTGLELRERLRELNPSMPVLFHASINYSPAQREKVKQDGDSYLLKPVASTQLMQSIATLLARPNSISSNPL